MDKDLLTLIRFLSKKKYVTIKNIENGLNISRRQATYRIEKLNILLKDEKAPLLAFDSGFSKGLNIDPKTMEAISKILSNGMQEERYYMNKQERLIYMYLMLFLNLEYLSLNDFIASLNVSRSTVLLDLKELMQILEEKGIQVKNDRKKGYYLVGSDIDIRRMMMTYVTFLLAEGNGSKVFDVFIEDYRLDPIDFSRLVITELAKEHRIRFVEGRLFEFIYIFTFLKARMLSGKSSSDEIEHLLDLSVIKTMKEYDFTLDLLKNYKDTQKISEAGINYIASWILGISFGDINEDTKDCILISDIIGKIMTRFELLSGAHYSNTEEIFIQLYSHFRPAYYRLIFKLPIYNPICEKVKEEYHELYRLVEETMRPLTVIFGGEIPEDELAYLTMHFAMIYTSDRKESEGERQKIALVACSNGIGNSSILYNELRELFPELHFLPPMEISQISEFEGKADIIFVTSYIPFVIDTDIPVIRVSPVMTSQERYQVTREVYQELGATSFKCPSVDVVMEIVAKYTDIRHENALYNELAEYFSQIDMMPMSEKRISITQMVRPSIIKLGIEALDWEDAVRKAYDPMVENGYITQRYVEETIRSVKLWGPYIVVTKHVALSHTKPEAGALSLALGIGILKEPVAFGNTENDPVKYIFSLSATDNESHLLAMSEFLRLLDDDQFYQVLDNAESPNEIIDYIKKY